MIIGSARAFRRNHCRSHRALRCASAAKYRAFIGLLNPLQDQSAYAFRRLVGGVMGNAKADFRIKVRIFLLQAQSTLGDFPDSAPLAGHDAEYFADQLLSR